MSLANDGKGARAIPAQNIRISVFLSVHAQTERRLRARPDRDPHAAGGGEAMEVRPGLAGEDHVRVGVRGP
jgi:hypothetical protein